MKITKRCFAWILSLILPLGLFPFGVFATSDEIETDTGQEEIMEATVEMDGATEEQPEETETPSEPESGLGTVIDPETGTEYEILSSVEDILPEEFTDEEIAEAVLEEMSELVDDVLAEMEDAPEDADADPEPTDAEAEPVPAIVAGVQALLTICPPRMISSMR